MGITESILNEAGATLAAIKAWLNVTSDNMLDFEPQHDTTTELGADHVNKLTAGAAQMAKRLRPGNVVGIPFELTGLAASATAQALIGGKTRTVMRLFKDATIIGISAEHTAAIVSGTLTVQPQIDAVDSTFNMELNSGAQVARAHQIPDDAAADDVIDASDLDTLEVDIITAALNPSGNDVFGFIWLSVGEEEDL